MLSITVEMQGMQKTQNRTLLTRRTQNEEDCRSEKNSEINRIKRRNFPCIYCIVCIFTERNNDLDKLHNLLFFLFYMHFFFSFSVKLCHSNFIRRVSALLANVLSELLVEWVPDLFALLFRFSTVTSFSHHFSFTRIVQKS